MFFTVYLVMVIFIFFDFTQSSFINNTYENLKAYNDITKILKGINMTATGNAISSMFKAGTNNVKKEIRNDFKKSFDLSKKDILQQRSYVHTFLAKLNKTVQN